MKLLLDLIYKSLRGNVKEKKYILNAGYFQAACKQLRATEKLYNIKKAATQGRLQ
jgi:hypothetical protein